MAFMFTDKTGHEWDCMIDVPTIERLIDNKTCDLYGALDKDAALYKSIMSDPRQLMGVVFAIIELQAKAAGITPDAWRKAIDGDTLEAMGDAFTHSLAFFSPARKRALMLKGWEKGKKIDELNTANANAMLDKADPTAIAAKQAEKAQARFDQALRDLTGDPSGAPSGDTPAS